jgi:hypothetical protein
VKLINKVQKLKDKIKKMRQSGLEEGGEYSIENLVFKTLRRNGYLNKLNNIGIESYDKEHTIYEKEDVDEEDTHGYEHEPYVTDAGIPMGFEGWSSETVPSGIGGGDFSSDYSSDFSLEESLKRNLRNLK